MHRAISTELQYVPTNINTLQEKKSLTIIEITSLINEVKKDSHSLPLLSMLILHNV